MDSTRTHRSDRVMMSVRVLVSGSDVRGTPFMEETTTVEISRHGSRIVLRELIEPSAEVNVRNIATGYEAEMQVIGQIASTPRGYHYGMRFSNPNQSIWELDFPPISESENTAAKVVLECERCHGSAPVHLKDFEVEVFEAQRELALACSRCRLLTSWKSPGGGLKPDPGPDWRGRSPIPFPAKPQEDGRERRKQKRLALKMQACIRTLAYGDEVVSTENVSKGGLSFKSSRKYGVGMVVEVCVPYSSGSGNIFSRAKIVGRRPLPHECTFVFGVAYLNNSEMRS